MLSRVAACFAALLVASSLAACSPLKVQGDHADRRLVLTGSSTVAPLALEIAKRFETRHPAVRVDVQTGGSSRGIADARRGLAHVGMVSRALKPDETDLRAFAIARDGICLIVHRDNPIGKLSDEQVAAVYRGTVANWSAVGGLDAPITVVHKAEGRSTLELFLDYFQLKNTDVRADVVIGDNEQGIKTVAGNPHAIGYVSIGTAEYDAQQGIPIKLLPIGAVAASVRNVADGSFPLSRPLNLVTREEPAGLARAFIQFAQSEAVHDLVREQYFVPLAP
ncbi:MAG: phosphate ABC transporter substrate-binding protein [Pirellulaceae bacterium]|nr:phosphate ABC transporter substrate-binding protein [Pirellulaceae bacterium]